MLVAETKDRNSNNKSNNRKDNRSSISSNSRNDDELDVASRVTRHSSTISEPLKRRGKINSCISSTTIPLSELHNLIVRLLHVDGVGGVGTLTSDGIKSDDSSDAHDVGGMDEVHKSSQVVLGLGHGLLVVAGASAEALNDVEDGESSIRSKRSIHVGGLEITLGSVKATGLEESLGLSFVGIEELEVLLAVGVDVVLGRGAHAVLEGITGSRVHGGILTHGVGEPEDLSVGHAEVDDVLVEEGVGFVVGGDGEDDDTGDEFVLDTGEGAVDSVVVGELISRDHHGDLNGDLRRGETLGV